MSDDDKVKRIAKKYFDCVYNAAFRDLMGSVTEEEYELVKKPEMFDLDMDYEDYIKSIQKGAPQTEIDDTLQKIEQFLKQYIVFQEEIYQQLIEGMGMFIKEHSSEVKQNIAENMAFIRANNEGDDDEEKEDYIDDGEDELSSSPDPVMRTGTNNLDTNVDPQQDSKIAFENEEKGVMKVRISGKDIELDTYGNIILNQLYSILFTLFCMINQMSMQNVPSDRPKIYVSPLEDQCSEFSLRLDKIE